MWKHLIIATALCSVPVLACEGEDGAQQANAKPAIQDITVDQLAKKLEAVKAKKMTLTVFDANSDKTRAEKGIIPTAVLLPSSSDYDLALLPKDKAQPVAFYCAAEKCSASKTAAKRALEAGHTKVLVLPEGIAGWLKAGKAVDKVAAPAPAAPAPVENKPLQG